MANSATQCVRMVTETESTASGLISSGLANAHMAVSILEEA